ncbi:conserved hypothetical protein [Halorhabdus utahensis DSM 12940]|uniref:Uncharacterized protein n=1 Tax=Halorhabdus utahensis (strain DSM 12940 / JCM 11049 / AX-2) TaxID=519442 RepID=C7NRN1_HALUD|nr:hypothetical protein [Halorhabdus utahensis]ACV11967.1 conserved hypothetical protein [Halorhabdus utahensis DSM 12940]
MTTKAALSEPQVLAHAKQRLFPEPAAEDTYAVVDTQFASEEWLAGEPIEPGVRERLAPFNHVQVGSGYPDLVGVRQLETELLAIERLGDDPPLVAIEAKGDTEGRTADVERGIVQAYDRLHEANAAYVAAPKPAISNSAQTLARELNVGVLGVDSGGAVDPLEVPRVVGNRTVDEAAAIRFQATAQGVAEKSFSLNHPKNYLAYPLAFYHPDPTDQVLGEYVVSATDGARQGAAFLGLIDEAPDGTTLTPLGREVVRFARHRYGTVEDALVAFDAWQGSRKRFVEIAPEWGQLTRRVLWSYPATKLIVEELQTMHDDGIPEPSLVELVTWLHVHHPTFTVELFIRGSDSARSRVLTEDGELKASALSDGNVYHAPTVFQLKAMCYHAGILTERGAEPHRLDPETDVWQLVEPLDHG